ncbi:hypothetical protein [Actinoplanes sp. NPDC049316]|uniref:hypothetical protein n=1 Tax=Actinoplanes sp. NPDC049316 TaxID=3154727 RepID=UPI0034302D6C
MTDVEAPHDRFTGGGLDTDRGSNVLSDSSYFVASHDWPAGARPDDPSLTEIYEALSQVGEFYEPAVKGLLAVTVGASQDATS